MSREAVTQSLGTVHFGRGYDWNVEGVDGHSGNEWAFRLRARGDSGGLRISYDMRARGIVRGTQGGSVVEVSYAPTPGSMVSMVVCIALAIWGATVIRDSLAGGIVAMFVGVVMLLVAVGLLREAQSEIEASVVTACAAPDTH